VIGFGLRLSTRGGKESLVRLVVMALAVSIGVAMLLLTLATINGLGKQNARGSWMATRPIHEVGFPNFGGPPNEHAASSHWSPIWWNVSSDQFESQLVVRIDVASTGTHPLVPPGIKRLPGAGQFYASPALAALLRTTPASELGARFTGSEIGTIAVSVLPSPKDLVIIIGQSVHALSHVTGAGTITSFVSSSKDGGPDTTGTTGLQIVLGVLALVLLFPVLVFIGAAMRLSAARREQRFAAIRLAGATMRQVSVVATIEALVAALAGVVIGFGLYFASEPALVHVPFSGQPLESGDLSLGVVDVVIVMLGVPLAAAVVARLALRRVEVSPLGVTRRVTPKPPRAYRVIPLLAGIAELAYFVSIGRPSSAGGQTQAYLLGFFLIMVGLVLAGPWLTMQGSKLMAQRTSRVSVLLAGRRLSDNPRGAFRAISGLILAIFVTSVSVGVISTILSDHGSTSSTTFASKTVTDQFAFTLNGDVADIPASVTATLRTIHGVNGISVVYVAPNGLKTNGTVSDINGLGGGIEYGLASCAQLASTPALGRCHRGATYAALADDVTFMPITKSVTVAASTTWPSARFDDVLSRLPVQLIAVSTNGSVSSIDKVETVLDRAFPFEGSTSLFGEVNANAGQLLKGLQTSSEVVILASLLIAGCSLAVAMAAGVSERRRPFSLMRLSGAPLGMLQRMVALETAGPLLVIAVGSALIGFLASDLFLRSQLGLTLRPPGLSYYVIVLGGLIGALAMIASTMPLLDRATRPEDARTE
jgi:hypothetical protein